MNEDDTTNNEYDMIYDLWNAIGNLPCSHCDFLGEDLYDRVYSYLYSDDEDFDEDDEDDDYFIDSDIEIDNE